MILIKRLSAGMIAALLVLAPALQTLAQEIVPVSPGIWKIVYGEKEKITPLDFKEEALPGALQRMPAGDVIPAVSKDIRFTPVAGGVTAEPYCCSITSFFLRIRFMLQGTNRSTPYLIKW